MTKRPFSNRIAAHSMTMPSEGIICFCCTTYRIVGNIPKRKLGNLNKFKCKRAASFTTGTHEVSSSALNFHFMLNEFAFSFPIRRCCWPKHLWLKVLQSRCLFRQNTKFSSHTVGHIIYLIPRVEIHCYNLVVSLQMRLVSF